VLGGSARARRGLRKFKAAWAWRAARSGPPGLCETADSYSGPPGRTLRRRPCGPYRIVQNTRRGARSAYSAAGICRAT